MSGNERVAAMRIDVSHEGDVTIVRPTRHRLDVDVAAEFRAMLLSLVEQGRRHLVIDLCDVKVLDSSGLGALVSALKTLRLSETGGDLRLARVQPTVSSLLSNIRLDTVFSTYATVEEAARSYRGDADR